jgi:ferredoxin--NADP+ reductase
LSERDVDGVWAIGPAVMMKFCAVTTEPFEVPTIVSLNTIMVDGTGMCGGCRVKLDDGAKFVCVDGPEFDAHKVDWDLLLARQQFYEKEEQRAMEHWQHECRLEATLAEEEGQRD